MPYEAVGRRRRRRAAHRVGRVPLARLRARARRDAPAGDRRCPQPARSGGDAPARLRLPAESGGDRWRGSSSPAAPGSSARICATRCSRAATRSSRSTTSRRAGCDNVAHLAEHAGLRRSCVADVVRGDSRSTGRVDGVLHFASPASPPEYLAMPLETLDVSSIGTRRALDLARANDARFLLASTSEIYGDPLVHPQPESYNGNVDPIGSARGLRRGEALRRDAHDDVPPPLRPADRGSCASSTPTARGCARPTGASCRTSWCRRSTAKPLTMYGTRNADALVLLRRRRGARDPRAVRLRRRASRSTSATRSSSRCSSWPSSCCEVTGARAPRSCSSRCRSAIRRGASPTSRGPEQLLGWEPKVELREGLERTHAWYLEERARGRA